MIVQIPDCGECEVSYQPMKNSVSGCLLKEYLPLLEQAQSNPKSVCEKIEKLYGEHPDCAEISNLLSFVYLRLAKINLAEALIKESYEKYPHYLFAKINYADQCIRKGHPEEILKIFASCTFEKKPYHYSEIRGYAVVMGFYHLALKDRDKAKEFHQLAVSIDPSHPSVRILGKNFNLSFFKKILARFF